MNVNFEFLCSDPIENVITCLNYQIDAVIYFGYGPMVEKYGKNTEKFLKRYCSAKRVEFYTLPCGDLNGTLSVMGSVIKSEIDAGNNVFFDITGGESLSLVSFGILSSKYNLPMHEFDITSNRLTEHCNGKNQLSSSAVSNRIDLTLEKYIELYGGVINKQHQRFSESDYRQIPDIAKKIFDVSSRYSKVWNQFINLVNKTIKIDKELIASQSVSVIRNAVTEYSDLTLETVCSILRFLDDKDLFSYLIINDNIVRFKLKNSIIKRALTFGGFSLEYTVFEKEAKNSQHCLQGVNIDWDGIIHESRGEDVLNEIDVLSITGNVPRFISCKSGKLDEDKLKIALYELETVANRFGGKHAEKILVKTDTGHFIGEERAEEMGIIILTEKRDK